MANFGHDYFTWSHDGTCFWVTDASEFASQHLPKYFKHNNYASFARLISLYGENLHMIRKSAHCGQVSSGPHTTLTGAMPKYSSIRSFCEVGPSSCRSSNAGKSSAARECIAQSLMNRVAMSSAATAMIAVMKLRMSIRCVLSLVCLLMQIIAPSVNLRCPQFNWLIGNE